MDIIFPTGSCLIIQSYSPGGANSTRTGESRWDACPHFLVAKVVIKIEWGVFCLKYGACRSSTSVSYVYVCEEHGENDVSDADAADAGCLPPVISSS